MPDARGMPDPRRAPDAVESPLPEADQAALPANGPDPRGEPAELFGVERVTGAREDRERGSAFRLAMFGALIVVVLFAGYGIGRLNNSVDSASSATTSASGMTGMPGMGGTASSGTHDDTGTAPHVHNADGTVTQAGGGGAAGQSVGGLAVTSAGLTMRPENTVFEAGRRQALRFRVDAAGGAAVTTYATVHDKPLHLVIVRRDLSGFQHLHPAMAPDGTWSIDVTLAQPGSYRAVADFTAIVAGQQVPVTLGVDLTVAGNYTPLLLPEPVTQSVVDGFTVRYEGRPQTTATQPLLMTVSAQDGRPAGLEPYLGAFGHLVVLREGDVGYVHVHPEPQLVDGAVKFWLAAPGPGRYRMFFDFQVANRVHTAAFTTVVG
jgi:hypothetical protein